MTTNSEIMCTYTDCYRYSNCLEGGYLLPMCRDARKKHPEDYYWYTGEVEDEAEFLQDLADDGLFEVPKKKEVK